MGTKAQHAPGYAALPKFLKELREEAGMTQRQMGEKLKKPQSYIFNCETGLRRVDVVEFVIWSRACGVEPRSAFGRFLKLVKVKVVRPIARH